jgi:hypothetical protein
MAGSFTDYLEDQLIDHIFGTGGGHALAYVQTALYVGLSLSAISDSALGTAMNEPADGYARVQCKTWTEASGGATANAQDIEFAQASGAWGKILDFFIADALTNGNVIAYGDLTISKSVESGDTPKFATGDLDITLS